MVWGKAGSTTTTSSANSMDSGTMSASETNQILCHVSGLSASTFCETVFNSDTGSNYTNRGNQNGGTDFTRTSQSDLNMFESYGNTTGAFLVSYFVNISGEEKLGISKSVREGTSGAGNTPQRDEVVYKWTNTSSQITSSTFTPQSGTIDTDSNLTVLGSEITPAAAVPAIDNVQDNSLFVEKENARRYWFSADNSGFPTNSSNYPDGNNGTNGSRIDIPTTGLTSLTNGSVAFWVYPLEAATDVADFVVLSGSDSSAASTEMIFGFIGNTSKVGIHARSGGSWTLKLNAGSLPKSQWSHVVYTNSTSSGNKVYVNGAEVTPSYTNGSASSNVFFNNITTNTFTIGANKDSGGYQWGMEGNVQQVLIYNTTLSASDVTTLYNSGNYNSSPSSTGLLRRYELTSDVNDSSGNSQNGTASSISFTSVDSPTPATWTMQPTLEDAFTSSTGWTQVTNTASGVSGGELIGLTNSSGTNGAGAWKDYGLVDDEKFVLRCKFQIVTQSGGAGNASTLYFGISDTNGATSPHSNRDGFGIAITNYASSGMLWTYPDGTTWDNADTDLSLTPTATTYYLEIARTSATSVTFTLYSDSAFSTVVKTHTQTIASTLNGLRYIMFQEWRNSSGNTTKVAVDDLQIFNGVGTVN